MPPCATCASNAASLGEDRQFTTAHGRAAFAAGDRIQFTGTDKKAGIANGNAGIIEQIDGQQDHRAARRQEAANAHLRCR